MKPCPYCREDVRDDATKCRYCGSSLVLRDAEPKRSVSGTDLEPNQVVLVLDRGLLYFGKFVIGVVVILIALGAAFFGFDMNRAREDIDKMREDVRFAQEKVQGNLASTEALLANGRTEIAQIEQKLEETRKQLDEAKATAQRALETVQQEATQVHATFLAVVSPATNSPASSQQRTQPAGFTVPEIAKLYSFPAGLDGKGQTVGLIELGGGYRNEDLDAYFLNLGLHRPHVTSVSVDHTQNQPGGVNGADGEVMMNIEIAGAVAPEAEIVVYFAPNTNAGFADAIVTASKDQVHKPSVLLIGWGGPESTWPPNARDAVDSALRSAAQRGITVVVAAGDNGTTDGVSDGRQHVDFPASSQWVLAVGATSIKTKDGRIESERIWTQRDGFGSATGSSDAFALPDWQSSASVPARKDGTYGRAIPDVAAVGDPSTGYVVRVDGTVTVMGGTTASASLWAGLIALLNQGGGKSLGHLNPMLYTAIGPAQVLRSAAEPSPSAASSGWKPYTGWGTPDGEKLLAWLRDHAR